MMDLIHPTISQTNDGPYTSNHITNDEPYTSNRVTDKRWTLYIHPYHRRLVDLVHPVTPQTNGGHYTSNHFTDKRWTLFIQPHHKHTVDLVHPATSQTNDGPRSANHTLGGWTRYIRQGAWAANFVHSSTRQPNGEAKTTTARQTNSQLQTC